MSTTAPSTATSSASAASSARADPEFDAIETLYGVGYRFDEQDDEADLALSWSGAVDARAPHPRGEHPDARCSSRSASSISTCFRNRLSKERIRQTRIEATADRRRRMLAAAAGMAATQSWRHLASRPATRCGSTAPTAG